MAYVIIKQGQNMKTGDREPDLVLKLYKENNNPEDLTSVNDVSVYVAESDSDSLMVNDNTGGNVSVSNGTAGEVTYSWASGDTDSPGAYVGEAEVEFSSGETKTFPSSGQFDVYIEETLQ